MFAYTNVNDIENIIFTDISKDGAMQGTNRELYSFLQEFM